MLTLRGASALSAFRLDKLTPKMSAIHPQIRLRRTEFVHFAGLHRALSPQREEILASLLSYGEALPSPAKDKGPDEQSRLFLVVPRPGTISPWSSKATDIAHNCGLDEVERLERGVAWYFSLPPGLEDVHLVALQVKRAQVVARAVVLRFQLQAAMKLPMSNPTRRTTT